MFGTWSALRIDFPRPSHYHCRHAIPDHLQEQYHSELERRLDQVYSETNCDRALRQLQSTIAWLEKINPDAAASLREGAEETLTVIKLVVHPTLLKTVSTTNPVESAFSVARKTTCRVKRWRAGDMRLRWCAAGLLDAESRFRRVKGYKHLPDLEKSLDFFVLNHVLNQVDNSRQAA